jgi:hypothetical protein
MKIVVGIILAAFVLLIIVGSVGAWYESRATDEWQKKVGQVYADVGGYGLGLLFLITAGVLFYQLSL